MPRCACGCGQTPRTLGSTYLRGHSPSNRRRDADFWAKVERGAADECWEYTGSRDKNGYGKFGRFVPELGGKLAHRRAWAFTHGQIPGGLCVLHKCDNPPCCNPAHLYLGTHLDNARDRMERNRGVCGTQVKTAKLLVGQVHEIRALADAGWVHQDIADAYGIDQTGVSRIARRKGWASLPEAEAV